MAEPRAARELEAAPFAAWRDAHAASARDAAARIARTPLAVALTVLVIGIALALPAGLHLVVTNLRAVAGTWESAARISVFLEDDAAARKLADKLAHHDAVARTQLISRAEALEEFKAQSGFGEALDMLDENPLPAVVVVTPTAASSTPAAVAALRAELERAAGVELVQLDAQWLERLHAMLELVRRAVVLLAVLFALAVVVVVGNTIRLDIQNRRQEIEVAKLIGATDAWIRRPFLYEGGWYGVLGGLSALALLGVGLWLMHGPVAQLAGLYGSDAGLVGIEPEAALTVLGAGALLGWAGSWLAVARHLGEIEPT
jgi:cell division transport system permease protein